MKDSVTTIGVFDGVHIGHQRLLERVRQVSTEYGYNSKAYVISYPFEYFRDDFDGLIMPLTARIFEISKFVDEVEVLDLLQIKDLSAEVFFGSYLAKNTSILIVGEDFRFGKGASVDVSGLKQMCERSGIRLEIFPEILDSQNRRISSSLIRTLVQKGDLEQVVELLGRDFSIYGSVDGVNEQTGEIFIDIDDSIVKPEFGTFKAFERNFGVNGVMRFGDRVTFVCKDLHPAPHSTMEVVLFQKKGEGL
ncbi:MAG TPA: hypothetical protein PLD34_10015 [Pseudothermotoga sp.]|nr:hypothetical protein [Pseudothermotoga sp.]